ncbi:3-oxoacyl-[acyl-carrier-protein] reductase FabG [Paenibacillus plantiphilus]|uniref:3-oxoacyl-[acyl-carrier-protein] reductase FabG n=1 Tax=Paenibacillus plantiphilus TaxID=2905650 RepID=A0ABN8G1A7_9BACL|nr:SDR family oxidoreductase [Paenibacillus plantiphilus]CAH1192871.1 3-oxoacyl-[acyl-carrier-protein] reductase FabG [Paenibacillus plantiphilus]
MNKYSESFSLKGKSAIITGAVGILGQRFCHAFAEFGSNVIVVDIDEQAAVTLATELEDCYGVQAIGVKCNVADPKDVAEMVEISVKAMGDINILHNNAASKSTDLAAFLAPFEEYTLKQWQEVMSVNLDGVFLVAQAVGKQMIKQGIGGSIIQTASIYGVMAPDHRIYEGSYYMGRPITSPAVYSASKAGVIGLTRYLSTYWAQYGIRVNSITPGGVESGQNEEFQQRYSARVPLARMAKPDEMTGAVLYLASDASSYVTGQNIIVDGGLNAW